MELPHDLDLDLTAFCEAHFDASHGRIVREALRQFIEAELKLDPVTRSRFAEARHRREYPPGAIVQLMDAGARD